MADSLKKLKYEKGDKSDTGHHPNTCPNGHALSVRKNRQRGNGRVYCPTCGWSDGNSVTGSDPAAVGSAPGGITILSQRGREQRRGPDVIGGGR